MANHGTTVDLENLTEEQARAVVRAWTAKRNAERRANMTAEEITARKERSKAAQAERNAAFRARFESDPEFANAVREKRASQQQAQKERLANNPELLAQHKARQAAARAKRVGDPATQLEKIRAKEAALKAARLELEAQLKVAS